MFKKDKSKEKGKGTTDKSEAGDASEPIVVTGERDLYSYEIGADVQNKAKRNAGHENNHYGVVAKSALIALDILRNKLDLEKIKILDITSLKRCCRVDAQ